MFSPRLTIVFFYFIFTSILNVLATRLLDTPLPEKYDIGNAFIVQIYCTVIIQLYMVQVTHI